MNTTIVFPDHFEIRCAEGNMLQMTRLYRFRHYEGNAIVAQNYVAAMETKREPFLNHPEFIVVFKIDAITGAPLWVPVENEDVYAAARSLYDNFQSAGYFVSAYRKRLFEKYDAKILPYLEELEIKLMREQDARSIALSLCSNFDKKLKALRKLHKAMCATDKGDDMREAADTLVYTLWGDVKGLEIGTSLLYEVGTKDTLLNALYDLILLDAGDSFSVQAKARAFILRTYWAQPRCKKDIYDAIKTHFDKAGRINRLLELHAKLTCECSVSKEDVQNLWFVEPWRFLAKRYGDEITIHLNKG